MADIETYRRMLPVNKHRLDDELEIQPDVMMRIAAEVVVANSRMLAAKDDLAITEARLTAEASTDAQDRGVKMTVDERAGWVTRHRDRARSFEAFLGKRALYEEWSFLLDAWRQRGFTMRELTELFVAQYFSSDSAGASDRRKDRDERLDAGRAEMRKAGHAPLATTQAAAEGKQTEGSVGRRRGEAEDDGTPRRRRAAE